jgi:hypothetical protein
MGAGTDACNQGRYRLIVVSPGGAMPILAYDDVDVPQGQVP